MGQCPDISYSGILEAVNSTLGNLLKISLICVHQLPCRGAEIDFAEDSVNQALKYVYFLDHLTLGSFIATNSFIVNYELRVHCRYIPKYCPVNCVNATGGNKSSVEGDGLWI